MSFSFVNLTHRKKTYACLNPKLNVKVVKLLLDNRSDNDVPHGDTPFHSMCKNKSSRVETLKLFGHLPNHIFFDGLLGACLRPMLSTKMLVYLLEKKSLTAAHESTKRALHFLCDNSNATPQLIETILSYGVSVNERDGGQKTALYFAAKATDAKLENVKLLVERGCRAINEGLRAACMSGKPNPKIIEYLILQGADPIVPDVTHQNAIDYLCDNLNFSMEALSALMRNVRDTHKGENPEFVRLSFLNRLFLTKHVTPEVFDMFKISSQNELDEVLTLSQKYGILFTHYMLTSTLCDRSCTLIATIHFPALSFSGL